MFLIFFTKIMFLLFDLNVFFFFFNILCRLHELRGNEDIFSPVNFYFIFCIVR